MRFKLNAIFFQNDVIAKVFVISFFKMFPATNTSQLCENSEK